MQFWDILRFMKDQRKGMWICCGDFNEVPSQDEHYGPSDQSENHIELVDLGFSGPKFTWCNRQTLNATSKFALTGRRLMVISLSYLMIVMWRIS